MASTCPECKAHPYPQSHPRLLPSPRHERADEYEAALNCTSRCFETTCVGACLHNCSVAEALELLPPCVPGPDCVSAANCSAAVLPNGEVNCSAFKAFERTLINITQLTEGVQVWVPPWDQGVCEGIVDDAAGAYHLCLTICHEECELRCPLPPKRIPSGRTFRSY